MTLGAFAISAGVVALGEMGDKTQLLALLLAARFKQPLPVIAGIAVATLLNHALAGAAGMWLGQRLDPQLLRWGLGAAFIAMALWMLVPDRADDGPTETPGRLGVFGISAVSFFLAEMGDKTQVATMMLAARFDAPLAVIGGTTVGILLADIPAVLLGEKLLARVPLRWVQRIAAAAFALLGVAMLAGWGSFGG